MTARSSTNKPKYVLPDDNTSMPSMPSSSFRRFATRLKQVCQHILPASPSLSSVRSATPSFDTSLNSISRHLVRTGKTRPSGRAIADPTTSGRPNRLRKRSRAQRGAGSSTQRRGNVQEDDTLEIERNLLIELARERRQYQISERRRTASSSFYSATAVGSVVGKEVNSPGGSFKPAGVSSLFRRSTTSPSPLRRHHSCYPIHPSTHQDVSGYHDPEDDASIAQRRNSSSCPSLLNQRPLNEESPLSSLTSTSSSGLDPPEEETENNETNEILPDSTIDEDALFFSPPLRHCSSSLSARASATGSGSSDLPHYSDARTPPLTPSTPSTVIHNRSSPSRILRGSLSPPTPTRTRAELTNHYPRVTKRPPFSLSLPSFAKRRASLIRKLKIETVILPSQNSRTSTHHAPLPPSHLRSSPPSSTSTSLIRTNMHSPTHSRSRSRSVFTDEDLFGFGLNQIASTSKENLLQTSHRSISLGYKNAFARLLPQDEDDGKDEAVRLAEQREWHQKLLKFAAGRDSFEV